MTLEAQIARLLKQAASGIVAIAQQDITERIDGVLRAGGRIGRGKLRVVRARNIRPCRVPGCGKPSKGPRFHFLCEDHRSLPKAQVAKLLAGGTTGAKGKSGSAPKKATSAKKIAAPKRAASGKAAKPTNIRPCRVPGCGKPSKGPRFHFLCEDHRKLPKAAVAKLLGAAGKKGKAAGKVAARKGAPQAAS